jgi:ribosomal protein S18 acetylase RimI-like enzyme
MTRILPEPAVCRVTPSQTRPLRQAVLRPHQALGDLAASEPPGAFAVGAFGDGDELVAVGLVGPDGAPGSWRVRGMATAPEARGHGLGTAVLDALLGHATAQGARRVWCNARTPARSLYERAGFRAVSEEFELPYIGPHLVMERLMPVDGLQAIHQERSAP